MSVTGYKHAYCHGKYFQAKVRINGIYQYIGTYKTAREASIAAEAYKRTAEYKTAVRTKRSIMPKTKSSAFDYKKFINEKPSYELDKPLSAGRGGVHYGKVSAIGAIAESGVKQTRSKKKEHVPYKPTPQMHTLRDLRYIREFGIPD